MSPFGRQAPVTLGRRNAERNPRRTSATASALMISVALISGLVVIGASAKASIDANVASAIGDFRSGRRLVRSGDLQSPRSATGSRGIAA